MPVGPATRDETEVIRQPHQARDVLRGVTRVTHLEAVEPEHGEWLEASGYQVFRCWNWEVRENLDGVIETMLGELGLLDVTPHPGPPPRGVREGDPMGKQRTSRKRKVE